MAQSNHPELEKATWEEASEGVWFFDNPRFSSYFVMTNPGRINIKYGDPYTYEYEWYSIPLPYEVYKVSGRRGVYHGYHAECLAWSEKPVWEMNPEDPLCPALLPNISWGKALMGLTHICIGTVPRVSSPLKEDPDAQHEATKRMAVRCIKNFRSSMFTYYLPTAAWSRADHTTQMERDMIGNQSWEPLTYEDYEDAYSSRTELGLDIIKAHSAKSVEDILEFTAKSRNIKDPRHLVSISEYLTNTPATGLGWDDRGAGRVMDTDHLGRVTDHLIDDEEIF